MPASLVHLQVIVMILPAAAGCLLNDIEIQQSRHDNKLIAAMKRHCRLESHVSMQQIDFALQREAGNPGGGGEGATSSQKHSECWMAVYTRTTQRMQPDLKQVDCLIPFNGTGFPQAAGSSSKLRPGLADSRHDLSSADQVL